MLINWEKFKFCDYDQLMKIEDTDLYYEGN